MNKSSLVGIVVVGYNSKEYLKECFDSIFLSADRQITAFFVDNNSTDQSSAFVREHYPEVAVVHNQQNEGFASANNRGITLALQQGVDYVLLLNPDTIIDSNAITRLVSAARVHTIVQPLILLYRNGKKTNVINTAGNPLHYLGISYAGRYGEPKGTMKKSVIASASGAAVLIPRSVFERIGMFDPSFFMYHEDLDFCWRARMAGFEVEVVPDAVVWHKYQFSKNPRKMYFIERNRLLFILKNYQLKTMLLVAPMWLIHEVLACLLALKDGWIGAKLQSYVSAARLLPLLMRQRTKSIRTKTDGQLKRYWSSELQFSEFDGGAMRLYNRALGLYWFLIQAMI